MGRIHSNSREIIHKLRKKRNQIFHVNPNPDKRGIEETEVIQATNLATNMFFKSLSITHPPNLVINDLRMKMNASLRSFFNPNLA